MELLVSMVVVLVVALAFLPAWPYSLNWGYYPTGACAFVVVVVAALVLAGRL